MTWLLSGQNSVGVAWAHYIAKTSFSLRSCATFFKAYLSPAGFTPKTLARCIHQGHCRLPSKRTILNSESAPISNSVRDRKQTSDSEKGVRCAPACGPPPTKLHAPKNWANHEKKTSYTVWFLPFSIRARMGKPRKNHVLFLLPCLPGVTEPVWANHEKTTFYKVWFFRFFFFSSFLASHRGDIRARIGKPRNKHVFFKVCFFSLLPCLPQGWHQSPYGQTTKKTTFYKVCFFVFSSFLASHSGDIRARMGKPRKNDVLQSVVFSFFPPPLPFTGVT